MSTEQAPTSAPLLHEDRQWVFGPVAATFGIISSTVVTILWLMLMVKGYNSTMSAVDSLSGEPYKTKSELAAKLLAVEGVDVDSVALYLAAPPESETEVVARTPEARKKVSEILGDQKVFGTLFRQAKFIGIELTRKAMLWGSVTYLLLMTFTTAVAGRRAYMRPL